MVHLYSAALIWNEAPGNQDGTYRTVPESAFAGTFYVGLLTYREEIDTPLSWREDVRKLPNRLLGQIIQLIFSMRRNRVPIGHIHHEGVGFPIVILPMFSMSNTTYNGQTSLTFGYGSEGRPGYLKSSTRTVESRFPSWNEKSRWLALSRSPVSYLLESSSMLAYSVRWLSSFPTPP